MFFAEIRSCRRAALFIMAAALAVCALPSWAAPIAIDICNPVVGPGDEGHWEFAGSTVTIKKDGVYSIVGGGAQTGNRICVDEGVSADIALSSVNIDVRNKSVDCAFELREGSNVAVRLEGASFLASKVAHAGLWVREGASLAISGPGALTAMGGGGAAGIGGRYDNKRCGDITIKSGEITAVGGENASGIGGGNSGESGRITIEGGTVSANGGNMASGIGGGMNRPGGEVIITGGTVVAVSPNKGAGIGGGNGGGGGTITISGGRVDADGGYGGAGIGGGNGGDGGTMTISGGRVDADGGMGLTGVGDVIRGAGIGGGNGAEDSGDIGIGGNAVVFANSISKTADIGTGVVFDGDWGMARGDVALADDLAIPSGKTLVVPNGAKLSVPGGVTLTIEEGAALDNQGTIINRGTIIGTVSGNPPKTPPGQPSGVVAVPGDSCATVTFAPPGDGNCPITGYTVKSDPGGVSVTGNSASVIVNGLANGTAYTFTVSAANGVGTGPISAPSPAVTPKGAQGPPSAPVVAKKTATNVTLRETEGAEYGMSSGGPWQKAPAFGGLFPNTEYNFFARLAETATHNASPSSGALTLMTDAMAGVALEESLRLATKDMPDVSVAPSGVSGDALRVIEEKLGRDAKPIATVHGAVFKPTLKPAFAATNEAFGIEGDFFRAVAQSLAVEIPLGGADGNVFAVELEVSLSGRPSFEAWGSLSDEERVALLDAHGMLFAYEFANRWRPLVGAHSGVGWDAARRVGIVRLTPTGVALSCAVTDSEGEPYAAGETIVVPDGSGDETIVDPMWLLERAKTSETEKTSASSGGGCETGATGLALAALVPALTRNRHRKRK